MSDPIEIQKIKLGALRKFFTDLGYRTTTRIGQNEFSLFLNKKSKTGRFDPLLLDKLFQVLNLDEMSTLSIEDFIYGFLQFDEDIRKNAELFKFKLAQEQEIYDKILKQCRAYQSEKLNAEGFCENAKIYGEITDIDIRQKLEGIKEIIIIVIYNEKREELRFKIGDKNSQQMLKKSFSFKPTSRKDHFEFIMKGVNDKDQAFDIGSKVFPLDDIGSQEEYFVQIIIPEIDKPDVVAAYINASIILYMSDYKYYEALRRKQEKRLKKYIAASTKASEYLRYVTEIYGDLSQMKPELIVDFNNEKLMQRKGAKLNVNFNNMMEAEAPGGNYFVEFNNEREVQTRGVPLRVEFNNSKEVVTPVTETKKYEYKYNYSSSVNQNIINNLEKKIELLQNEKDNLTAKLKDIPKPNLEQVNIKKTTEKVIIKNQDLQKTSETQKIPKNINPEEIVSNEQIIKEQIKSSQQISQNQPIEPNSNSQFVHKIVKTTTSTKSQNMSTPYITRADPIVSQDQTKLDTDSFLKQTTTTQGQNISSINNNYSQINNAGLGSFIQKTTETTKTTTTNPVYYQTSSQVQNSNQNTVLQSVNGQTNSEEFIKNFLSGQYNAGNTTTSTTTYSQNQYNFSNMNTGNNITTNISTNVQNEEGGIGYGTDASGTVNEYGVIGTNTQTLQPIIKDIQVNSSYSKAIFNETTNKTLISENTLPVSYLPDKVNELIVEEKVTTLPLITTTSTAQTNNVLQPIIHEPKTIYVNENNNITTDYNNANITDISSSSNIVGNTYGTEYNFISNGTDNYSNNYESSGIITNKTTSANFNGSSFNNYDTNNWVTTQTTETTTTTQYNNPYSSQVEGLNIIDGQQIQYGI
jgi:hypothetical protein